MFIFPLLKSQKCINTFHVCMQVSQHSYLFSSTDFILFFHTKVESIFFLTPGTRSNEKSHQLAGTMIWLSQACKEKTVYIYKITTKEMELDKDALSQKVSNRQKMVKRLCMINKLTYSQIEVVKCKVSYSVPQ